MNKNSLLGITEDEIRAVWRDGLTQAGTHPAMIHAVDECGFILTEANAHLFTDDDLNEWEDAIDAYMEAHPDAPPLD